MRRSYHEELSDLSHDVVRLARMATRALEAGTEAFLSADLAAAKTVIAGDDGIDELTRSIEERACRLLALQQPMASDLRLIVAILRTIHEIERSGDLVVNIAKATRRLYPIRLPDRIGELVARMGNQAAVQFRVATEAFADEDAGRAAALDDMDDIIDELQKELFRAIFATTSNDEDGLHLAVQLALVARYYERIADHAVNMGQRVAYMVTGEAKAIDADAIDPGAIDPGGATL